MSNHDIQNMRETELRTERDRLVLLLKSGDITPAEGERLAEIRAALRAIERLKPTYCL